MLLILLLLVYATYHLYMPAFYTHLCHGVLQAVEEFHGQVAGVATKLLTEFRWVYLLCS